MHETLWFHHLSGWVEACHLAENSVSERQLTFLWKDETNDFCFAKSSDLQGSVFQCETSALLCRECLGQALLPLSGGMAKAQLRAQPGRGSTLGKTLFQGSAVLECFPMLLCQGCP